MSTAEVLSRYSTMNKLLLVVGVEKTANGTQLSVEARARAMRTLREYLFRVFGGYTLAHAEGGWVNSAGVPIVEGALRLEIHTETSEAFCRSAARTIAAMFKQSSVQLEYTPCHAVTVEVSPTSVSTEAEAFSCLNP